MRIGENTASYSFGVWKVYRKAEVRNKKKSNALNERAAKKKAKKKLSKVSILA